MLIPRTFDTARWRPAPFIDDSELGFSMWVFHTPPSRGPRGRPRAPRTRTQKRYEKRERCYLLLREKLYTRGPVHVRATAHATSTYVITRVHVQTRTATRVLGRRPRSSKHWPAAGGEMPLHITTRRTVALHWRRDTTVCVRDSARRRTRRRRRGPRAAQCYTGVTHVEKCLREIRSPASRLRPPHCHTVLAGVPVLTRAAAWRRGCEGCVGRG